MISVYCFLVCTWILFPVKLEAPHDNVWKRGKYGQPFTCKGMTCCHYGKHIEPKKYTHSLCFVVCCTYVLTYVYPHTMKLLGGILVSLSPSHIPCLPCSAYSSGLIHFMFIHLIKQPQKMCHVWRFLQSLKIWSFGDFFKFVILTLSCFDLGYGVNH